MISHIAAAAFAAELVKIAETTEEAKARIEKILGEVKDKPRSQRGDLRVLGTPTQEMARIRRGGQKRYVSRPVTTPRPRRQVRSRSRGSRTDPRTVPTTPPRRAAPRTVPTTPPRRAAPRRAGSPNRAGGPPRVGPRGGPVPRRVLHNPEAAQRILRAHRQRSDKYKGIGGHVPYARVGPATPTAGVFERTRSGRVYVPEVNPHGPSMFPKGVQPPTPPPSRASRVLKGLAGGGAALGAAAGGRALFKGLRGRAPIPAPSTASIRGVAPAAAAALGAGALGAYGLHNLSQ